ncbi:MAG TPA: T9SS type A sorting domain-containing protein [Ferruginibacter sp.]|nr:T9SS type A sorting domain-containing protein [Ferruginibacter sp.]HMP21693.1 T9SS type A sorting domain-containing protein [Ferruginibacter sp.]
MKRILLIAVFSLQAGLAALAQPYFQATFENPANPAPPPTTLNQLVFKIKPTADITTAIAYMEFAFRYPTATTPPFGVTISSNTTNFPTLNIQRLDDYVEGAYTYVKFVHNTGVIPSATYPAGVEREVFTITLTGNPGIAQIVELVSDLVMQNYVFGVVDGAGNFIDPGAGPQLYGNGFAVDGSGINTVPLASVPVPVKFLGFSATKKGLDAVLTWAVENESSVTDRYEVMRSLNGRDFTKVATVAPKNNGLTSNTYELTEVNLAATLRMSTGVVYYRIKQIDKDGASAITESRSIRLDGKGFGVNVYPNPVKSLAKLTIDLDQATDVMITVTNASGQQIKTMQLQGLKGTNFQDVDMARLAGGNYIIKVQAGTEIKTLPVSKVN